MKVLHSIAIGLSQGLVIGFMVALIRLKLKKQREHTPEQIERGKRISQRVSAVAKYCTFTALLIGLVWSVYFMILGLADPAQTEYATNISQLIVSVLTIVSIIFAFFEFVRRK